MRAERLPEPPDPGVRPGWRTVAARVLLIETVLVVALAVGVAAARAVVRFAAALTSPGGLAEQTATLNPTRYPGQPSLDLAAQLVAVVALVLPAALAIHLALRDSSWADLGLGGRRWGRDVLAGAGIAAVIGTGGLALYLASRALGLSVEVRTSGLVDVWWTVPVLILAAGANAVLEEVVVVGYLMRRLDQLGVPPRAVIMISAAIRSTYHVYQGAAGLVGNLVMGVLFAGWFRRTRRLVPLIVAHWVINIVAFVGYVLLVGRVSWL